MRIEVEIKAWVDNRVELEQRLAQLDAQFIRHYQKVDRYFQATNRQGTDFAIRLRQDNQEQMLTYKDRQIQDGVELNREYELVISDATIMVELLQRLGAQPLIDKVKTGSAYRLNDLLIEVSLIGQLGQFVEVEYGAEVADDEQTINRAMAQAKQLVKSTLRQLGIADERIEKRSYIKLLSQVQLAE